MEKTILVIEDQDDLRLLIRLTLKQLGRVSAYADARGIVELVQAERPALLVLDVWLGAGLNGLDVCRELKAGAAGHVPKVLMLSACGQQSDVEAGMAAGADRYVVKPFSPESLVEAASSLLAD
jgi:two-component system phosphate regulon response regulator PhoB